MPPQQKNAPKTLIVLDACLIEGEHVELDTVLRDVEAGIANDLLSSGRFRVATGDEDIRAAEKRAKDRVKAEKAEPVAA